MSWYHKALHEPLLHFVAAGAVLFLAGQAIRAHPDLHQIIISPQRQAQLANRYALQFGVRPDPKMMQVLVKSDVHDEILFREGLAMGLDQDDEIVRRRIIQKMQFLLEDVQVPPEPGIAQLQAYYHEHSEHYQSPALVTFTHVYFSTDGDDANARSRAAAALVTLAASGGSGAVPERAPDLGDAFPDLYDFADYSATRVEHLFGPTEFAASVFTVPTGKWAGPFKSACGWHLIYVRARTAAREQPFAAVRDKVRADYLLDSQKRANDTAFEVLARQFTVTPR